MKGITIPQVVYYNFFPTTFSIHSNCFVEPAKQKSGSYRYISIPYETTAANNSPVVSYNSINFFPIHIYIFQKDSTDYWFIIESQTTDKNTTLYMCLTIQPGNDPTQTNDLGALITDVNKMSENMSSAIVMSKFDLNNVISKQQPEKLDEKSTYINVNGAGTVITVCSTFPVLIYGESGTALSNIDPEGTLLNDSIFSALFSTGGPTLSKSENATTLSAAAFTQKLSCKAVGTDTATEKGFAIPITKEMQSTQSITIVVIVMFIVMFIRYTFPGLYEMFIFPQNSHAFNYMYPTNGYNRNLAHVLWTLTFLVLSLCLLVSYPITGNTDYMYSGAAIIAFLTMFMTLFDSYNKKINSTSNNNGPDEVGARLPDFRIMTHFVNTLSLSNGHTWMLMIFAVGIVLTIIGIIVQSAVDIVQSSMGNSDQSISGTAPGQNYAQTGSSLFISGICIFPTSLFVYTLARAIMANASTL